MTILLIITSSFALSMVAYALGFTIDNRKWWIFVGGMMAFVYSIKMM
jgi:hypothetical protein